MTCVIPSSQSSTGDAKLYVGTTVRAEDDEVLDRLVLHLDRPEHEVVPRRHALVGHAEADSAVVHVRSAFLDEPLRLRLAALELVELERHFAVPLEPQPAQRLLDLLGGLGHLAPGVGVLDPQQELAALVAREEPVEERRADVPTCRNPVGLGAMRTRTGRHGSRLCGRVLIGGHCGGGIKGSIDRALEIGADAFQFFAQANRAWHFPDHDPALLEAFREKREATGIGAAFIHALYLLNLASENPDFYEKSTTALRRTAETATAIGAEGVCFHTGSHLGGGLEASLDRIAAALEPALAACSDQTWLLIENTAGSGGTIGRSVDELATIVDRMDKHPQLGLCLDSCHLYGSGYDITDRDELDRLLEEVDEKIGLDRLRLLHINDSKAPLGSNRDRHDGVLAGLMGERLGVFIGHPSLQGLPAVIETGAASRGPEAADITALRELHARWTTS